MLTSVQDFAATAGLAADPLLYLIPSCLILRFGELADLLPAERLMGLLLWLFLLLLVGIHSTASSMSIGGVASSSSSVNLSN